MKKEKELFRFRKNLYTVCLNAHIYAKHTNKEWRDLVFSTLEGEEVSTFYHGIGRTELEPFAKKLIREAEVEIMTFLKNAPEGYRKEYTFRADRFVGFSKREGMMAPCPCDRIKMVVSKDKTKPSGFAIATLYPYSNDCSLIQPDTDKRVALDEVRIKLESAV